MKELLIVLPVINEKENLEKLLPDLLDYLEHKGDIYRAQGKIQKARKTYEQALENVTSKRIRRSIQKKLEELK